MRLNEAMFEIGKFLFAGKRAVFRDVVFEADCRLPLRPDLIPAMTPAGVEPAALAGALVSLKEAGAHIVSTGVVVAGGKVGPNSWWATSATSPEYKAAAASVTVEGQAGLITALEALREKVCAAA